VAEARDCFFSSDDKMTSLSTFDPSDHGSAVNVSVSSSVLGQSHLSIGSTRGTSHGHSRKTALTPRSLRRL
jgi:hypothetical protein